MKKTIFIITIFLGFANLAFAGGGSEEEQESYPLDLSGFYLFEETIGEDGTPEGFFKDTTISSLKLFAKNYRSQKVSVKGYLGEWAGILFVFPTQVDAQMENLSAGLMVETTEGALLCKGNYVLINSGFIFNSEKAELGLAPVKSIYKYNFDDPLKFKSLCYFKP